MTLTYILDKTTIFFRFLKPDFFDISNELKADTTYNYSKSPHSVPDCP